ncbi:hypothetical protein IV203_010298 [Nitzschia inconspicua]|uniref:Uncharacterized protein n=1 Tax=Nitzschia inconspicua TaxID=303405 RepID=A0A9K3PKS4_9STRA|nr:hypothetical protein IV203_010298 [Nitzschia inconspicua]
MLLARNRWQQRPTPQNNVITAGYPYEDDRDGRHHYHSEISRKYDSKYTSYFQCQRLKLKHLFSRPSVKRLCSFSVLVIGTLFFGWLVLTNSERRRLCPTSQGSNTVSSQTRKDDVCFVTCIFGKSVEEVDQPANVEWYLTHWCNVQFFLVTNLPTLPAEGWNKIVQPTSELHNNHSNDFIVKSREAKFLGWKVLPNVQEQCAAVVYMDGYLQPKRRSSWWNPASTSTLIKFRNIVDQVQNHPWGLSQVKQAYFNGLPTTTILQNLVRDRKDTAEHVNSTLSWLQQQDDYQDVVTYYLNKYFAYDPRNVNYQRMSSWFWQHYTTYGGLWRDQPLWAYTLHHFNCTPAVMTSQGVITRGGDLFEKGGTLGWDQHIYVS